jgi:hypothetical protein
LAGQEQAVSAALAQKAADVPEQAVSVEPERKPLGGQEQRAPALAVSPKAEPVAGQEQAASAQVVSAEPGRKPAVEPGPEEAPGPGAAPVDHLRRRRS